MTHLFFFLFFPYFVVLFAILKIYVTHVVFFRKKKQKLREVKKTIKLNVPIGIGKVKKETKFCVFECGPGPGGESKTCLMITSCMTYYQNFQNKRRF